MDVVFRTDASLDIGTGHVMRSLTLADALCTSGAHCTFVSRTHPGNLNDLVRERGYEVLALPAPLAGAARVQDGPAHGHWLDVDFATDAAQTLAALGGRRADWLVMDHYALDARWQAQLRPAYCKLMVIDDLADRPHNCDLLLDQNLNRRAEDYAALVSAHCEVLAGPRYATLRPNFAALRSFSLDRRKDCALRRLLVSMGGVDRDNITGRVLAALARCPRLRDAAVTVVMGPRAPWTDEVREIAMRMPFPTSVVVNVRDMALLMAESDLAIGAAGTTAWERCCLGLPTIAMVLAPNQRAGALALEDAGAVALIPEGADLTVALPAAIERLAGPGVLPAMSAVAAQVTDGAGCALVAGRMVAARITHA